MILPKLRVNRPARLWFVVDRRGDTERTVVLLERCSSILQANSKLFGVVGFERLCLHRDLADTHIAIAGATRPAANHRLMSKCLQTE